MSVSRTVAFLGNFTIALCWYCAGSMVTSVTVQANNPSSDLRSSVVVFCAATTQLILGRTVLHDKSIHPIMEA